MKTPLAALSAALLFSSALVSPSHAETIDLSTNGSFTGQPGYTEINQTFVLPANAVNVALNISFLNVDDRGVVQLNGVDVDATGIFASQNAVGSFNFGQNAPTVAYTYNAQFVRDITVTTGFNVGGSNLFALLLNDTNNGIYGDVLQTAANGSYSIAANVSYSLAGVPEPSTWALMILGFGAVGGAMRRRQPTAATVRFT